jgi:diguanylate cyclase (GGDEF)-like protein
MAALAATYFALAKLSLLAAIPPGYATALWPPSGIALAAMALLGLRAWPGIWLGATLVNTTVQSSIAAAALMGAGNTLEALLGAALLRRFVGAPSEFKSGEDVFVFLGIAIVSPTVAASVASIALALVHSLSLEDLCWNWWTWWQGDAMGIILVTPLVLSWCGRQPLRWSARSIAEGTSLALGVLLTCGLAFGAFAGPGNLSGPPLLFLVLPFVMWAALRFRQREVTTTTAAISALAIAYTVQGRGPFAVGSLNLSLLFLLAFMSTMAAMGLVLNAVVAERTRLTTSLKDALRDLKEQAITDSLTGLYNRRFLEGYMRRELARAARSRVPVAVIMLDLDHFKRVNDGSGHAAGDTALEATGALLKRHVRASDVACRYGGEEFMLVLHDTVLADARRKAESIRVDVESAAGALSSITASFGIAMFPDHAHDADALIRAADGAMYEAKQAGRNCVSVSPGRQGAPDDTMAIEATS